jgi:hypothetical protein
MWQPKYGAWPDEGIKMSGLAVKICGITRLEDALAAIECGANMLGFNFYPPSPRYLGPRNCTRLVERLESALDAPQGRVILVGVFVNASPEQVGSLLDDCGLHLAQLSGDELPANLEILGERAFKVLRAPGLADAVIRFCHNPLAGDAISPYTAQRVNCRLIAGQLAREANLLLGPAPGNVRSGGTGSGCGCHRG